MARNRQKVAKGELIGSLVVYLCNRQIKICQIPYSSKLHIRMVMSYQFKFTVLYISGDAVYFDAPPSTHKIYGHINH